MELLHIMKSLKRKVSISRSLTVIVENGEPSDSNLSLSYIFDSSVTGISSSCQQKVYVQLFILFASVRTSQSSGHPIQGPTDHIWVVFEHSSLSCIHSG